MARNRAPRLTAPGAGASRVTLVIKPALAGERIDKAVAAAAPADAGLSRGLVKRIIGMGGVHLGQMRCRVASKPVQSGDVITLTWHPDVLTPEQFPLEVVYEDAHVAIVNKPAGQLSQGSELGDVGSLAYGLLRRFGAGARLMHRLDKPASGLLVCARSDRASAILTPQFRDHTLTRRYLAITEGCPPDGICDRALVREGRRMRLAEPNEDGISARSAIRVIAKTDARSLCLVTLFTGRTHQIRLHLSGLGAPIAGDRRYGARDAIGSDPRLCLHAAVIGFVSPSAGRDDGASAPILQTKLPDAGFWEHGQMDPAVLEGCDLAPDRVMPPPT